MSELGKMLKISCRLQKLNKTFGFTLKKVVICVFESYCISPLKACLKINKHLLECFLKIHQKYY